MQQARSLSSNIFKTIFITNMNENIHNEKGVSHAKISADIDDSFKNVKDIKIKTYFKSIKVDFSPNDVEGCYTPIV